MIPPRTTATGVAPAGAPAQQSRRPCYVCGTHPARLFLSGHLCGAHEPRQPVPDPKRTAVALRARYLRAIGAT